MHRRGILGGFFTAMGGLLTTASAASAESGKTKVVYHLADLDKVNFVLGNIKNHYAGVGGPANVTIALVVHGPALKAFHAGANPDTAKRMAQCSEVGRQMQACGNTMRSQAVTLKDLLPGFVVADQGGVVRLAELQAAGYLYLRP
jgi:intracellular sulfur oxidation DsrE/DsrF family protein